VKSWQHLSEIVRAFIDKGHPRLAFLLVLTALLVPLALAGVSAIGVRAVSDNLKAKIEAPASDRIVQR
jgi:hypothetical protein